MTAQLSNSSATPVWKLTSGSLEEYHLPEASTEDPASLNSISARLPAGAYTTFRTYAGGKVLRLTQHIARLTQTAQLGGFNLSVDEAQIRSALRLLVPQSSGVDLRVRLMLDLEDMPGELYIALQELNAPPEQAYRLGVKLATCHLQRPDPLAKRTQFILRAEGLRRTLPAGVEEAILLGKEGELLEGLSSNFFALRAGALWTAGEGVLLGVTRSLLLECAEQCDIEVHFQPLVLGEIPTIDEAFITSSSREVLPVVRIDRVRVGNGRPGPLTRRLMDCFQALVERELQDI